MQTALVWMLSGFVVLAGYPWAAWLLAKSPLNDGRWLTLLVGFALSLGGLTLLMFWEAVLGVPFNMGLITVPYLALALIGLALWRIRTSSQPDMTDSDSRAQSWPLIFAVAILTLISLAILFNAAYWPFSRPDALGIYARYGHWMWLNGTLVSFEQDDSFYQAYPVLVPLIYTYTYLASGWQNEYLARIFPALMGLACLPAAYLLGRRLDSRLVGWLSALLLALTPMFGRWASSGYVDLPMAFFYTMAVHFAWRLWQTGHWADALLTGAMMGLAAWTKNAALLGVALLSIWLLWGWVKRRVDVKLVLLALAACAAMAAPWYIRNVVIAGMIIPPTVWADQAQRTLDSLLIVVTHPEIFGLTGWVIGMGLVATIILILRRCVPPQQTFLLLWFVPFFAAWWVFASYDPRFLLLFLPLLSILAGIWAAHLWRLIPSVWRKRLIVPLAALVLGAALAVAWNSVEFKDEILRDPLMGDEAKRAIVLGEP